ncbi:MAG: 30S ribosomal protein S2 [Candidatus Nealsonbacteria bacterium]|nr:30S ribosomal protein S2 [Candidatus Nealsonbacteria bacterium]
MEDISKENSSKKKIASQGNPVSDFNIDLEEMQKAGVNFGHRTSTTHPKMKPYIAGVKNTIHIINLEKTAEKLGEALKFIQSMAREKKTVLLVGTKVQTRELVKETAKELGLPFVSGRWLGGTITNFSIVLKRLEYFKDLERKRGAGELDKYTKKERIGFDKELKNLENKFGGIKDLTKIPDAVIVLDMRGDYLAAKEAKSKGIPVVAICDTNIDPSSIDYPIPANDDAASSVKYILDKIKEAIKNAK